MDEITEKSEVKTPRRRVLKGRVVSDKMDKTIKVAVDRKKQHRLYGKVIKRTKNYLVHDRSEKAKVGDLVMIEETRPLSKRKRWRLIEILEKAK